MKIRLVVACANASGIPCLIPIEVVVTEAEYARGDHYEKAESKLKLKGYEKPFVCIDENDAPEMVKLISDRPDWRLHDTLATVMSEFGEWLDAADNQFGRESNEAYQQGARILKELEVPK